LLQGVAVTADYINLKVGIPERGSQVVEKIEHPGIVLVNFASAVVAQITVQASQGLLVISLGVAVDNVQSFASMYMNQMKLI
jgi:hypothetical protein